MEGKSTVNGSLFFRWGLRVALAGLFGYSGWIKILDPASFAQSVAGYDVVPYSLIPLVTFWIPWIELWAALAVLLIGPLRRSASLWMLVLLTGFTALKISAVFRGLDISCGCTGSDDPLTWVSVVENLIWMVLAGLHFRVDHRG